MSPEDRSFAGTVAWCALGARSYHFSFHIGVYRVGGVRFELDEFFVPVLLREVFRF